MPASFLDFVPLVLTQFFASQSLDRIPEPDSVMENDESVTQYDHALQTQLAVVYAFGLEVIYRSALKLEALQSAIDVACGTGRFTLHLATLLPLSRVVGVDLSEPMLRLARDNARLVNMNVDFQAGDAADLHNFAQDEFGLATFNQAAHHLPTLEVVHDVLQELDRITRPDGLVLVTDLVRLRNNRQTEKYVQLIAADFVARGLPVLFDDFRNSMFAAWSLQELARVVPDSGRRMWYQFAPAGLPTVQALVGLPVGRRTVFVRRGFPWPENSCPVPHEYRPQWQLLRRSFALGSKRRLS